ncbi:MAG TPA: hypothetical protein DD670_09025 [Planctomycetaceae bacterium]|nr:hypothetical protein [Planctomycetaceae bacterium]
MGYQPIIEKTNFGTLLEIRPTLIPGSESAVVDLRSTVTTPGGPASVGGPEVGGVPVPRVDRFAMETQEFATTLSMPLGRPVLVGGLTYVTSMPSGNEIALPGPGAKPHASKSPDNAETPQLYLVLELQ